MKNVISNLFAIILLAAVAVFFRGDLLHSWLRLRQHYFPCNTPIEYNIGTFDTKFGISESDFQAAIQHAEDVWEKAAGRELFTYSPDGHMNINLIYDNRQDATNRLKVVDAKLDDRRADYADLKSNYDTLKREHAKLTQQFQTQYDTYTTRRREHNATIQQWNDEGGAPANEYKRLENDRVVLGREQHGVLELQRSVNTKVDALNKASIALNKQVDQVNQQVAQVNTISTENGEEFQEGEYRTGPQGDEINVYQYDNYNKLVRLLVHEFGHALGIDHVDDPDAIMYRSNAGESLKLTNTDEVALKAICELK